MEPFDKKTMICVDKSAFSVETAEIIQG